MCKQGRDGRDLQHHVVHSILYCGFVDVRDWSYLDACKQQSVCRCMVLFSAELFRTLLVG